jgi:hypothetical protein
MQQLLVDYRDTLPVCQLMPLGAIFDVLAQGADRPFTDKLREEFETARRFYFTRVRPYLLGRNNVTEEQAATLPPVHKFRAEDLVVKTLLLAALVPNVPALNGLTAARLAALNHGSIRSMVPNQERAMVTAVLKALNTEFGEVRLSGSEDDPPRRQRRGAAQAGPGPAVGRAQDHGRRRVRGAGQRDLAGDRPDGRGAHGERLRPGPDAGAALRGQPRSDPDDHRLPLRRGRPVSLRRRDPGQPGP